jgi:hypothetical protein
MNRPHYKPNGMPTPETTLARTASQVLQPGCDPYNTAELRRLEQDAMTWDPTIDTTSVRIINVR